VATFHFHKFTLKASSQPEGHGTYKAGVSEVFSRNVAVQALLANQYNLSGVENSTLKRSGALENYSSQTVKSSAAAAIFARPGGHPSHHPLKFAAMELNSQKLKAKAVGLPCDMAITTY
jgi:hypothetical protein